MVGGRVGLPGRKKKKANLSTKRGRRKGIKDSGKEKEARNTSREIQKKKRRDRSFGGGV